MILEILGACAETAVDLVAQRWRPVRRFLYGATALVVVALILGFVFG